MKSYSRDNCLMIKLTEDERKQIDKMANELRMPTSTWARAELLKLSKGKEED